ncbi:MAG: hypothetical protein MJ151_01830 [Lachnospiraceae bacterium]|nr:hypothetical protein [Lachnospiraceae bacterium]
MNLLYNMYINRIVRYRKHYIRDVAMPLIISVAMGIVGYVLYAFLDHSFLVGDNLIKLLIKLIVVVSVCIVFYVAFIITFGVVRKRDCDYIPFMSRLSRYMQE